MGYDIWENSDLHTYNEYRVPRIHVSNNEKLVAVRARMKKSNDEFEGILINNATDGDFLKLYNHNFVVNGGSPT